MTAGCAAEASGRDQDACLLVHAVITTGAAGGGSGKAVVGGGGSLMHRLRSVLRRPDISNFKTNAPEWRVGGCQNDFTGPR